jgi:hypothetical protein
MSDSTTQAPAIRKYINLHQDYEARYWSEKSTSLAMSLKAS